MIHLAYAVLVTALVMAFPIGMGLLLCLADDHPAEGAWPRRRS